MKNKTIIYITVQGGVVQEVQNVPAGVEVQVIDYDIEQSDSQKLEVSPMDGEACSISTFH